MFLTIKRQGMKYDGEQFCSGLFLVLCQPEGVWENGKFNSKTSSEYTRAFVRFTSLRQLGHFMMGIVRVNGTSIVISGSYGQDGLPKTVSDEVWKKALPLPQKLYDAWSKGGGWNSCGNEVGMMREWGLENIDLLRRAGK